jgi:sec-independent protein translocase protein TatA
MTNTTHLNGYIRPIKSKCINLHIHLTFKIMTSAILLGMIGPWQIVLIVLVFLLMFGGKKIPELMKGLGKGMKEFKDATKDLKEDNKED